MLDKLEVSIGESAVLGVAFCDGSSSDLFLHIHHIALAYKERRKVLFISSKTVELNLRIFASKLAIRWDQSLLKVLEIGEILNEDIGSSSSGVCETITKIAADFDTILIEDGTVFEAANVDVKEVTKMVEMIASMEKKRVFISLSSKCVLYHLLKQHADYNVEIKLIGGGFGKDVTGTMSIRRNSLTSLMPEKTELLYLTGERSMKAFHPGHASIFF